MADEPEKKRRIKYALERPGSGKGDARQDMDNPMSPNFFAIDARNEGDKARWWALYGSKKARQVSAVLEHDA